MSDTKERAFEYLKTGSNCIYCYDTGITNGQPEFVDSTTMFIEVGCFACGAVWSDEYKLVALHWDEVESVRNDG